MASQREKLSCSDFHSAFKLTFPLPPLFFVPHQSTKIKKNIPWMSLLCCDGFKRNAGKWGRIYDVLIFPLTNYFLLLCLLSLSSHFASLCVFIFSYRKYLISSSNPQGIFKFPRLCIVKSFQAFDKQTLNQTVSTMKQYPHFWWAWNKCYCLSFEATTWVMFSQHSSSDWKFLVENIWRIWRHVFIRVEI